MSCGYGQQLKQTTKTYLFTAYVGPVSIPNLAMASDLIKLRQNCHGVDVNLVDGVQNNLVVTRGVEVGINERLLASAQTKEISQKDNTFYGLAICLAWQQFEKAEKDKVWWQECFDTHIGDRNAFFDRASREFSEKFTPSGLNPLKESELITFIRRLSLELMPVDVFHHIVHFCDFLQKTFGEVNLNHSRTLPVVVNVPGMENAYCSSSPQQTYLCIGNGKQLFLPLGTIDVIAHELGHAVVAGNANLVYRDQSGAMNESFADIMGYAGESYIYDLYNEDDDKSNDIFGEKDWFIGEQIFLVGNGYMRSMSRPEDCRQPSRIGGQYYYTGQEDNGGVHTNSGIGNHCFYKICQKKPVLETLRLYYKVLRTMNSQSTYADCARLLLLHSGNDAVVVNAVAETILKGQLPSPSLPQGVPEPCPRCPDNRRRVPLPNRRRRAQSGVQVDDIQVHCCALPE